MSGSGLLVREAPARAAAGHVKLLIAAMGGEGGGVLTGWIVRAAQQHGLEVQATSIPGVAQRTGATTYYLELAGSPRVMSLSPSLGDVDVMVASELLEAGRAIAGGFVTPDRTVLIASTHRVYAIAEKSAGADGRYDPARLIAAAETYARRAVLFDMEAAAAETGSSLNAVLMGAIAGAGVLPVPPEGFEAAIHEAGLAVEGNLRGFRAGFGLPAQAAVAKAAIDVVAEGVRRLTDYQDEAYARLYLERLTPFEADPALMTEIARHLALRMSFEDVIRVAQLKIRPERLQRLTAGDRPVRVVDYFKPGIEEVASALPARLGRALIRRFGPGRHVGLQVTTTSLSGWLRLKLLASLRRFRPRSLRWQEEQDQIEAWLADLRAAPTPTLAREIAELAQLIKGYGDTWRRGLANYQAIRRALVEPALAGRMAPETARGAIAEARRAALQDPERFSVGPA